MNIEFASVVYHGTVSSCFGSIRNGIDLNVCNVRTDFGQGFYTTFNYDQAMNFARQKAIDYNNSEDEKRAEIADYEAQYVKPIVIELNLNVNNLLKLKGEFFEDTSDKWVEFVYNNRVGIYLSTSGYHNCDKRFDFVYGYVADTSLYPTIKKYKMGKISFEELKKGIQPFRYSKFKYDQLSFHSEEALKCLKIKSARIGGV